MRTPEEQREVEILETWILVILSCVVFAWCGILEVWSHLPAPAEFPSGYDPGDETLREEDSR